MKLKSKLKTEIQNAFCYSNFVCVVWLLLLLLLWGDKAKTG